MAELPEGVTVPDITENFGVGTPTSEPVELNEDTGDFDAWVSQLEDFSYDNAEVPPVDDEEIVDEVPDETPTLTPPVDQPTVRIGDNDVPLAEVTALYEFGKAIRTGQYAPGQGKGTEPTSPAEPFTAAPVIPSIPPVDATLPPPLPDWVDTEDSFQVGMYRQQQELFKAQESIVNTVNEGRQQTLEQRAQYDMNVALTNFRAAYPNLTDEDIALIRPNAAPMVGPLMAANPNPVEALSKSMYIASLELESTRHKVLRTEPPEVKSQRRKDKLSALNGGGTSARTPAQPRLHNDRSATDEFASALAESFGQTGRLT